MVTKSYHADRWDTPWETWQLWFSENTAQPGAHGILGGVASGETVSMNQWLHLAFTYDGTAVKVYVNGVEKASAAAATPGPIPETLGNIYIGRPEYSNHSFLGLIDEVAIWDHALSAAEIAQQYQNGLGGTGYLAPSSTLTVARAGTGTGTVASSPAGITCGSDCSEVYAFDTPVALTAAPDSGSTFSGWSGACSGSDPTCALTMGNGTTVTATVPVGNSPSGVVVHPAGMRAYAANYWGRLRLRHRYDHQHRDGHGAGGESSIRHHGESHGDAGVRGEPVRPLRLCH